MGKHEFNICYNKYNKKNYNLHIDIVKAQECVNFMESSIHCYTQFLMIVVRLIDFVG